MIRTRLSPPLVILAVLALILPVGRVVSVLTAPPPAPAIEGDTEEGLEDEGPGAIAPESPLPDLSDSGDGTNFVEDPGDPRGPGQRPSPAGTGGPEQGPPPAGDGGEEPPLRPPDPDPKPDPAPSAPPKPEPDPVAKPDGPAMEAARFVVPAGFKVHHVAAGETLSQIAGRYSTSVTVICETNRITTDLIQVGQPLFVQPGGNSAGRVTVTRGPAGPGGGELLAWEHARWLFGSRQQATIRDPATGREFRVVRLGGGNHADCEPLTVADTEIMRAVGGGGWTWTPKPVHVIVDGRTIAASINFMPHSVQTIADNGFDGHFCVHFLHSRTHNTNSEEPGHQANVLRAAGLEGVTFPPGL